MEIQNFPKLPFGLEMKVAYYVGSLVCIQAETPEAVFIAEWDGVSTTFHAVRSYPRVEFKKDN